MATIIHGENTVQSRQALTTLMQQAKTVQKRVEHLEAKSLDVASLAELLGSQTLFGEPLLVVIEELHSLPKSARKDQLIELLGQPTDESVDIILWEKRQLTPTMIKKFPGAKAQEFKITNVLFKWLDSLSGAASAKKEMLTGLQQAIESDGEFMCLSMLARQVRLLLQAQEGNFGGMAPFMIGKLKKQASSFTEAQLLKMHRRLLEMDIAEKTSSSPLSLTQQLELLVVEL